MTRNASLILALCLAGCASQSVQQCVTAHSPGVTVQSTDPRVASIAIVPTVTKVCLMPAYVEPG